MYIFNFWTKQANQCYSLIIPRVGKVISLISRVVFPSVGDMSENTTKIVYLTLTKSGIRGITYLTNKIYIGCVKKDGHQRRYTI
jgi:hypothetical protein